MLIREYKKSDFERICEIGKHIDPTPPPLYFRSVIADGKTWVMEDNGKVVGFLISTLKYWKEKKKSLPYVNSISVDESYRNQGIATNLLNHFEKYYKSFYIFGLYVRVDNYTARRLYEKLGYSTVEVLEKFYGKDKDGLFMVKSVSS